MDSTAQAHSHTAPRRKKGKQPGKTYASAAMAVPVGWPASRITTTRGDDGTVSEPSPLSPRLPPVLTRRSCSGVNKKDTRREEGAGVVRKRPLVPPPVPAAADERRGVAVAGARTGEALAAGWRPVPRPSCPACGGRARGGACGRPGERATRVQWLGKAHAPQSLTAGAPATASQNVPALSSGQRGQEMAPQGKKDATLPHTTTRQRGHRCPPPQAHE